MSDSQDSDSRLSSDTSGLSLNSFSHSSRLSEKGRNIDLTDLEKDTERLNRKAKKRLSSGNGRYESFLQKLVNWQHRQKLDKIKSLLDSLFPKLKQTEGEVLAWLECVQERKEMYRAQGGALLREVDSQLSHTQSSLDFLDEAVQDVYKIDYDILKEIGELKMAYAFNQEVLRKTPTLPHSSAPSQKVSPMSHSSPSAAISSATAAPSPSDDVIRLPSSAQPLPCIEPAVWQVAGTASGLASATVGRTAVGEVSPFPNRRLSAPPPLNIAAASGGSAASPAVLSRSRSVSSGIPTTSPAMPISPPIASPTTGRSPKNSNGSGASPFFLSRSASPVPPASPHLPRSASLGAESTHSAHTP
eukprot:gene31474-38042_t